MNTKKFKALKAKGCQEVTPVYWAQCQVGMLLSGLTRCLFLVVCKETDEIYGERIKLEKAPAEQLIEKAGRIIEAVEPPARISDSPAHWECKFCTYWPICHGCKIPEVHCRTCVHATPVMDGDGAWSCAKKRVGPCEDHLFIPPMMPPDLTVREAGDGWVAYDDADTGEVIRNQRNSEALYKGRME